MRGGGEGATAHCQKLWPQGGPHRKGGRESETGKKPHEELASETAKDRKWESPWRAHDVGGEEDCRKTYTWPGSNWRPSACEADVIATRPQVLDCARLCCREMKNHCEGQGREGGGVIGTSVRAGRNGRMEWHPQATKPQGRGESGWCSDGTSTPGAWRHAGVQFLLSGVYECRCDTLVKGRERTPWHRKTRRTAEDPKVAQQQRMKQERSLAAA